MHIHYSTKEKKEAGNTFCENNNYMHKNTFIKMSHDHLIQKEIDKHTALASKINYIYI